ncbi:MAG: Nitrilase/cyanide hydratase and apolipoprotein N-acyltransferase [Firmicutes bacterium]|nr:Nitrilase/cyanide hydratase and apolipoprotein N-acyltransferase [Bacillota bacterium]
MKKLRVTVLQTDLVFGDPSANLSKMLIALQSALQEKPDAIIWPEMWNTCYDLTRLQDIADRDGTPSIPPLKEFAAQNGVNMVAGSIADIRNGNAYNTTYVINRSGEAVAAYSKIHLIGLMDENRFISPGSELNLFTLDSISCGSIICYDLRFPELIRSLAVKGAEILFVPAQWPSSRLAHWRALLVARAIENQMYVVSANRVGKDPNNDFPGHSMVIDPWGDILYEAGSEEEIFTVELDIELVRQVRAKMPVFKDRVPAVYKLGC